MDKDSQLFGDKTFSDLLKDIYDNTKKKEKQITELINQLKPMIRNMTDASMMVPLVKEYLEVSVKNDDNLVKLTADYLVQLRHHQHQHHPNRIYHLIGLE